MEYNKTHNITPTTIKKAIADITEEMNTRKQKTAERLFELDIARYKDNPAGLIKEKRVNMEKAVERLDFETAAILRDEINRFKRK